MRIGHALPHITPQVPVIHTQAPRIGLQRVILRCIVVARRLIQPVELFKELALITLGNKPAEKAPVRDAVQTRPEVGHEIGAGGIFPERLLWVIRDVHQQPFDAGTVSTVRTYQQGADQLDAEGSQDRERDAPTIQTHVRRIGQHLLEHLVGSVADTGQNTPIAMVRGEL